MKTVQMTLDPGLLTHVDKAAAKLGMSRSAFTRRALRQALDRLRLDALEQRHREGYSRKPVRRGEFDGWETEQIWPE
jgi:metal-responsive CopG/Arc/MetJ family transcriptional regulator